MNMRTILAVAGVVLILACALVGPPAYRAYQQYRGITRGVTLEEVSHLTGMSFPSQARLLNSQLRTASLDGSTMWVKAEFPAPQRSGFVKSNHLSVKITNPYGPGVDGKAGLPWYKPFAGEKLKWYQKKDDSRPGWAIVFINTDDAKKSVVYIYWRHSVM